MTKSAHAMRAKRRADYKEDEKFFIRFGLFVIVLVSVIQIVFPALCRVIY